MIITRKRSGSPGWRWKKSPDYTDIRIFLGRLYTWSDQPELARQEFEEVLAKNPGHEDGSFAYGSLEYWNDQSDKALQIVNNGLEVHPKSQNLLLLKAKVLKDLKRFPEANTTVNQLLKINPKLTEARSLLQSIKMYRPITKLGSITNTLILTSDLKTHGTLPELIIPGLPKLERS